MNLKERMIAIPLTKTEKRIANYLLDHEDTAGFGTASELAAALETSDTSVIRFLRKIGYKGFTDFKKDMLSKTIRQINSDKSFGEKFFTTQQNLSGENFLNSSITLLLDNLNQTLKELAPDVLDDFAQTLLAADHKYIAGFRGTSGLSTYMGRKLSLLVPHVEPLTFTESSTLERICDIGEKDCLLIYSFPKYSRITETICQLAREHKAKILMVTDRVTNPSARYADRIITTRVASPGYLNSYTAPFMLTELILLSASRKRELIDSERIKELDRIILDLEQY